MDIASKKPRFVLIYDFLHELGGLEKLMAVHANFLKKEGYEVLLLFADIKQEMRKQEIFLGLELGTYGLIKKAPMVNILSAIGGFNKLKQIIKPSDIILSYSFPVNFTIRKLKNKKIVYMNHFPNFLYLPFKERLLWANNMQRKITVLASIVAGPLLRKIDKKLVEKNKIIFENSNFTKKRLDKIYNISGVVSYPPVSKDFRPLFDKSIFKKYSLENKFVFASGRIIPDKRIDWLIEAFSQIKDKKLLLAISGQGEEKYKKRLLAIAQMLGVEKRVCFLGIVPKEDLIKLNSLAEVYAFSAPKEDFGLAPIEAISCGTPCIVWGDGSGPTEQVINGVNGYYAKPYDTKDFAEKIEKAISVNIKNKNKKSILKSAKKFSQEEALKIFLKNIDSII